MKQCFFITAIAVSALSASAQNYFLATSKDGITEFYILKATVDRKAHVTEVYDQVKPATGKLAEFRKQVTEDREKASQSTAGFDKLGYYRRHIQYSCKEKKYREMGYTYYDLSGKVIEETENDEKTKWMPVPAGTLRDMELKKVCGL